MHMQNCKVKNLFLIYLFDIIIHIETYLSHITFIIPSYIFLTEEDTKYLIAERGCRI